MAETKCRWEYIGYENEVYADENGKIVGEIRGGYRRKHAHALDASLGEYVDTVSAKRAVERVIAARSVTEGRDPGGEA